MRHFLGIGVGAVTAWALTLLPVYGNGQEQPAQKAPETQPAQTPAKQAPATQSPSTQAPATQAPATQRPATQAQTSQGQSVRGKIVKMEGNDRFIVQTNDNRQLTFYTNPQTRYTIDGRAGRFSYLRVGTEINGTFTTRDDRMFLNSVSVGAVTDAPPAPEGALLDTNTLRGRIIKLQPPDQVVIRTSAGKELVLFTSAQTRFMVNGKAVQFSDLRVGAEVNADFTVRDGRHLVTQITVGGAPNAPAVEPAPAPAAEPLEVQGTIVRVVGQDQVVIKTADNKEVTVYVQPQTKYLLNDQPARIVDFQPGADIRVQYDVRDRRWFARSILGGRRK